MIDIARVVAEAQAKGIAPQPAEPCSWCKPGGAIIRCNCKTPCEWYECLAGIGHLPEAGEYHDLYPTPRFT